MFNKNIFSLKKIMESKNEIFGSSSKNNVSFSEVTSNGDSWLQNENDSNKFCDDCYHSQSIETNLLNSPKVEEREPVRSLKL